MSNPEKTKKNFPFALILSYLFPGMGHFYLGRRIHGMFLFIAILSLYGIGIQLGGGILWEEMNVLTVLAYTVKFFNGVPFLLTLVHQIFYTTTAHFDEIGTTFILVSGALNLLTMIHLIDVAREETEK